MKILAFETEEWEHRACLALQPDHHVICLREELNADTAVDHADAQAISPFVNSRIDSTVLSRFPALQLVATRSTGYDHIDMAYCAAHGITVCNVPDYGDNTVAEHAFALLLSLVRHIVDGVERTRRGNFSVSDLRGIDLHGKTFGVIGTGRIGRCALRIARGFGMNAIACDLNPDHEAAERIGFRYVDFSELLSAADVISLHVPASPATRHLLSDAEFARMKSSAVLVNTARGNLIDTEALVRALADGRLGGAALDVLPEEPLIREEAAIFRSGMSEKPHDLKALVANHVLLSFPNVLVTPHIAYNTDGALRRIIDTTIGNIQAFASGAPQNVVEVR